MSRSRNGATAPGGHERIGQRHEARIVHEAAEEAKLCHPEARIEQRAFAAQPRSRRVDELLHHEPSAGRERAGQGTQHLSALG